MMLTPARGKITVLNKVFFDQVQEYIEQGKRVAVPVKGDSMRPFLNPGDRVLLAPFERNKLIPGMIVLAKVEGKMVLHRVVRCDRALLWLAGDGNLVQHEHLQYANVVATAVCAYRGKLAFRLDRRWSCTLGQLWYLIRPVRRLVQKCLNRFFIKK